MLLLLLCLFVTNTTAQKADDLTLLQGVLAKFHYQPRQIVDTFTSDVCGQLLEAADYGHIIFRTGDIPVVKDMIKKVVQEQSMGSAAFIRFFSTLYLQRIQESKICLNQACAQALDLYRVDTADYVSGELLTYAETEASITARWRLIVKAGILDEIFSRSDLADSVASFTSAQMIPIESEFRQQMQMMLTRRLDRIVNHPAGLENYTRSMFYNSLCLCYDPHSAYFSKEEMKMFRSQVTNEGYYFGFFLGEDESGHVYISSLTPGGSAWKSNLLNKGDILVALQWEGQIETDLSNASREEVSLLFGASIDKTLSLTVRKADGSIRKVKLRKEKAASQENIVNSFLLAGSNNVGYIYLPGFYSDAQGQGSPGCASDVAKEILKLTKEGIKGLILDLRQNGGGSVREAVDLAGIFVDTGPMCVFKSRDAKPFSIKDMNMGVAYAGPLVVLVDQYSASASEIVAGALQDYQRAIIIGAPTYGKATGQAVVPVDSSVKVDMSNMKDAIEDRGFVKVTTDQVFRITGLSHQKIGVQPDILLQGLYFSENDGERSEPFAFENSRIEKKTYFTVLSPLPLDTLNEMSMRRTSGDSLFSAVRQCNKSLSALDAQRFVLISMASFKSEDDLLTGLFERVDDLMGERPPIFQVENNQYDKILLEADETFRMINAVNIERLESDYILQETYNILNDLILIQSKK